MKHYFVSYMRMGIRYHKYYPAVSKEEARNEKTQISSMG
jgi:hypothetical protein